MIFGTNDFRSDRLPGRIIRYRTQTKQKSKCQKSPRGHYLQQSQNSKHRRGRDHPAALARELKSIRHEAEAMLREAPDDHTIWRLHDYLTQKRREIDQKYDYRYSVLMLVFHRLVFEGWLTEDDLSGIGA